MTIQSDHKALLFVGAIAILGAGVRIARANGVTSAVVAQPALDHQMQAADSSKQAAVAKRQSKKKTVTANAVPCPQSAAHRPQSVQSMSRGHINGRLDLDVATAAQIDSLPGVGPSLAKRIAADRMARGPFLELVALRRVRGVSQKILLRLDSLVTFSGTIATGTAADTIIPPKSKASPCATSANPH